jgi:hypothetical protein
MLRHAARGREVAVVGMERSTAAGLTRDYHPAAVLRQDANGCGISTREDRPHDAAREESHLSLFAPYGWSLFPQALPDTRGWKRRKQRLRIRPCRREQAQQVAFLHQPAPSTGLVQPEQVDEEVEAL